MARKTFPIHFDKHGQIVIDDPELARRIVYLLIHDRKLTLRLDVPRPAPDAVLPNYTECLPEPIPKPFPRNDPRFCPLAMCECELDLIDHTKFVSQWVALNPDVSAHGTPDDR
jgi:hypothetical protein